MDLPYPTSGGSYRQDPKTGELTRIEGTEPADTRAAEPTEPTPAAAPAKKADKE